MIFKKILIANRGEIAVRVARSCKKMEIQTVGIYSDADANSLHVKVMDEAHPLGGSRVAESYLNIEKILEIAQISGVDAIHPGYGLLSENAEFARRCEEKGIVFVGPSPDIIAKMGSKIESRRLMENAGVPIVPGITYPLRTAAEAMEVANNIGFPLMLKASAGGGGIGIQIVRNKEEILKAFTGNQKRAVDFFNDGAMYIEKYIEDPRHIEIQVLADHFGNTVFLGERECSIQRRHQKVLEEAPSLFLDEKTRWKMGEAAVKAAQTIGYQNAGTIEFLVDENKNYYFLEMNTRLQVEHPVTEEITGVDLVEEQLRIATGEPLSFTQNEIARNGHAIEVRIYAEDPKTFFPSPGTISKLGLPIGPGIRHEMAVEERSVITHFYDPMVAKLVVKGNDRKEAIAQLKQALKTYCVEGIKTNIPILINIVENPAFENGETTTSFLTKKLNLKI
jgi:acetyl-CoA carboxylase, biotin carboxylase subunit